VTRGGWGGILGRRTDHPQKPARRGRSGPEAPADSLCRDIPRNSHHSSRISDPADDREDGEKEQALTGPTGHGRCKLRASERRPLGRFLTLALGASYRVVRERRPAELLLLMITDDFEAAQTNSLAKTP